MFDVKPSLLRHWESKFDILRPHKNKKGNRMFTPEDVENLKLIYHLVKERGMTLNGAAQYLRNGVTDTMRRDMMLLDRLQYIRSELDAVRQLLRDGADDSLSDEDDAAASDEEYGPDDQTVDSTLDEPDHEEADADAVAAESTYDDDTDEALMSGNEASDSAQEQSSTVEAIEITAAETDVTAEMGESAAEEDLAAGDVSEAECFDEPEIFPEMQVSTEMTAVSVSDAGNPEDDMEDPEEELPEPPPWLPPVPALLFPLVSCACACAFCASACFAASSARRLAILSDSAARSVEVASAFAFSSSF